MLTQKRLKELVVYDPLTGVIDWVVSKGGAKEGVVADTVRKDGYCSIGIDYKEYLQHRIAFLYMEGSFPTNHVDHINGINADNRWVNLRACTRSENNCNSVLASSNTSGVKGVSWHSRNKSWRARLQCNKTTYMLGYFKDIDLAEECTVFAREILHKEFANHG